MHGTSVDIDIAATDDAHCQHPVDVPACEEPAHACPEETAAAYAVDESALRTPANVVAAQPRPPVIEPGPFLYHPSDFLEVDGEASTMYVCTREGCVQSAGKCEVKAYNSPKFMPMAALLKASPLPDPGQDGTCAIMKMTESCFPLGACGWDTARRYLGTFAYRQVCTCGLR